MPTVSDVRHPFEGISTSTEECQRIQQALGPDASILLMSNHGAIIGGRTVGAALLNTLELINACNIQLDMMQALGGNIDQLVFPTDEVVKRTRRLGMAVQAKTVRAIGELEMDSWCRLLDAVDPSYRA